MLQNYLKIALRNMQRNKLYSAINILSFALGIACSLAILLWVRHEWSFNRFHARLDRLYQVHKVYTVSNSVNVFQSLPGPFAGAAKAEISSLEDITAVMPNDNVLQAGTQVLRAYGIYSTSSLFTMFSFPVLAGNTSLLDKPNAIALSRSLAQKLFGTTDVVGQPLRLDAKTTCSVFAVFADIPQASSLQFEYVLPLNEFIAAHPWAQEWGNNSFEVYLLRKQHTPQASIDEALNALHAKYARKENDVEQLFTQSIADVHLYNRFENGVQQGGRISMMLLFLTIAAMILALACVNFTNLTTARGLRRSKEIGIRKSIGAKRSQIMMQILGESVLTTFVAMPIALLLVEASFPVMKELTGADLHLPLSELWFWGFIPSACVFIGCLAGLYPAIALSGFPTTLVIKGVLRTGRHGIMLRRGLVIVEFTIAVAFIAATIIVFRQVQFIKQKNIGLDRENVVSVSVDISKERFAAWKQELKAHSAIVSVSGSRGQAPIHIRSNTGGIFWRGQMPDEKILVGMYHIDYTFLETLGLQLTEGRAYSPNFPADTANFIINETCARQMRFSDPVGETLRWGRDSTARVGTIVGVVKDFHFASMQKEIQPMMLLLGRKPSRVFVRFAQGRTEEGLLDLQRSFTVYQPSLPFDYTFLDDEFNKLYKSETMLSQLALIFAGLAIAICSMGLFGLATFMTETRTKEVGIRKVLGASESTIIKLLTLDFMKLVGVSVLLALPLSWWIMSEWLKKFAYRTNLSWWIFIGAGSLAILLAFTTVAAQAWKAARANPVKSLHYE